LYAGRTFFGYYFKCICHTITSDIHIATHQPYINIMRSQPSHSSSLVDYRPTSMLFPQLHAVWPLFVLGLSVTCAEQPWFIPWLPPRVAVRVAALELRPWSSKYRAEHGHAAPSRTEVENKRKELEGIWGRITKRVRSTYIPYQPSNEPYA
jgi:hypothetical protein